MARALVLGNGNFLVCLDKFGFVRDMYYPYVGEENHVSGQKHRIGIMVNGAFSWIDDGSWQINIGYKPETMVGYLVCKSDRLNISIVMEDIVYNETSVFLRKASIYNQNDQPIDIKIFFHQVFLIMENRKRNTAFFDPTHNAIIHYRGRRVFMVNGRTEEGSAIDDFSVGAYQYENNEGTFRDAEDGQLGKNGVEHGSVDSVVRFSAKCGAKEKTTIYYWICAAKTFDEVYSLNTMVLSKTPQAMIYSTEQFWNAWLKQRAFRTDVLPPEQKKLFDTSLFVLRAHTDNHGSIIASGDSEMIEYGKDDYTYMWPRDASFISLVLNKAGFSEVTKPFFQFCCEILHPDGYLHHRYNPDKSLGSTWHSNLAQKQWLKDKILQLPIQEDESAAVLVSLWEYYVRTKDLEFIESLFRPLIKKIADFLVLFRDPEVGLPLPSYDLWEEKIGVSTFTCTAVYGGLQAAARFCELLGKRNHMREYNDAAEQMKKATIQHLYNTEIQSFVRYASVDAGKVMQEKIVSSSALFGLWYFNMLPQDDPLFTSTHQQAMQRLQNPPPIGGLIRYENDSYFKSTDRSNPWFITTMWEAERRLSQPNVREEDLQFARDTFAWVTKYMYPSGVLAEQLQAYTGESLSATPLVWSHAVYVETVLLYLAALEKLGKMT